MDRVVEIELWSTPRSTVIPVDGKEVAAVCREGAGLPPKIVAGLNFVPDEIDVVNLRHSISEGDVSQSEFELFCLSRGLRADSTDNMSAAYFLAFSDGQPLAWLHLPENAEGYQMATAILGWAESNGYVLRLGQSCPVLTASELVTLWTH